ncbi:hypothetical protein SAMN05216474_0009 [Lishizhenia tianjinensis]|uniref:Tetratricopeptide repeat-containing protein n=1 Tax=Lishizhenia tianjinensis TaxID=477690 RepID=A0A1I6X978_9FLAO|nr:hypothetical protein [Lishizhenia tianjinensis]SFT34581.1 hypothetical protein SAMN05216474_0009 [Lishizhenia tianjinensis]
MTFRLLLFSFTLFLSSSVLFSQEVQKATITYTPPENGYEISLPLAWKFINCYGEINVTITKKIDQIRSSAYIYNGQRYTVQDLGNEAFSKIECGLTDISADVYNASYNLGKVKMGNVIDWLGGCFGQTYHVIGDLGLVDADYKDKLSQLSLKNLKIEYASTRNYKLESQIKELEKQNAVKAKIAEARNAYSSGNKEEALKLYQEALKLDYSNADVKAKIEALKKEIKKDANQEEKEKLEKEADELLEKGNLEEAKKRYQDALSKDPYDAGIKEKIKEIDQQLQKEKQAKVQNAAAKSAASNRSHSGSIWGTNHNADSHGSATQAAHLLGNFRVDYKIWTLSGEPAHQFRFYWEWSNALKSGYPQWVSVLGDTVVLIKELKKYPDLWNQWNALKPLYVEIECDILYYKNKDNYVADDGTIKIIPEIIGTSGQEVSWSLPASSNWDELFPYCNGINWTFFREQGVYEEMNEYEDQFGTDIAWPKYAFEYSDNINYFQSHSWFSSIYKDLTKTDFENKSSSADVTRVVWPEEKMQAIIREFKKREKMKEESKMTEEDFWSTPENATTTENTDFWNTPENGTTVQEVKRKNMAAETAQLLSNRSVAIAKQREKYKALLNPFTIETPTENSEHSKNVVTIKGYINQYFRKNSNKVFLNLNGVKQQVNVGSDGRFSNAMVLSSGQNDIKLELQGNGFTLYKPFSIYYTGQPTDIRVTLTWNTSSSDIDLYLIDPNSTSCSYNNKSTQTMSLDVDDTDGYGPENISVINGKHGTYNIRVQNFSGGNGTKATVYIYVHEELIDVKTHTFYRNKEFWDVKTIVLN